MIMKKTLQLIAMGCMALFSSISYVMLLLIHGLDLRGG